MPNDRGEALCCMYIYLLAFGARQRLWVSRYGGEVGVEVIYLSLSLPLCTSSRESCAPAGLLFLHIYIYACISVYNTRRVKIGWKFVLGERGRGEVKVGTLHQPCVSVYIMCSRLDSKSVIALIHAGTAQRVRIVVAPICGVLYCYAEVSA